MKKLFAMMMTGVLLAGVLTGCGNNSTGNADNSNADAKTEQNTDQTYAGDDSADDGADESGIDLASAINVLSREEGSGTRGAFIELFGIETKDENGEKIDNTTVDATVTNSTEVMLTSVAGNPYAIGYVSLGSLNDTVKSVKIDGAEATVENIKNGSYTIQRPFNIADKRRFK